MKNMCVSAGILILFNQIRYEHSHHEKGLAKASPFFNLLLTLKPLSF
jgi:hypothetical protein